MHAHAGAGKTAELAGQWLKKGSKLYIEGRNQTQKWQDKEGNTRYATEVIADELTILSRPEKDKVVTEKNPYDSTGTPDQPSKVEDIESKDKNDLPF